MAKTYNVDIIGALTNNNGILSGFSSSSYAILDTFSISLSNTISAKLVTTFESFSDGSMLLTFNDVNDLRLQLYENTCVLWRANGEICRTSTFGTHLQTGDEVEINLILSSGNTSITVVKDNTTIGSVLSGTTFDTSASTGDIYIGRYNNNGIQYLHGSANLNKWWIKVNNNLIWEGVTTTTNGTTIQLRHDTASNFSTVNPVLAEGEAGFETDTNKLKIGNGEDNYNDLDYFISDDELYYKTGDTFTPASNTYVAGGSTNDKLAVLFTFPLPKRLDNITSITVTGTSSFYVYQDGGRYLVDPTSANISFTVAKATDNMITLRIDSAVDEMVTAGRSCCYIGLPSTLTFTMA